MGRPSSLSEKQCREIQKRILDGDSYSKLAKEFNCSKSAIHRSLAKRIETIRTVSAQMIATENTLKTLDLSMQYDIMEYSARLRAINSNLMEAAFNGTLVGVEMTRMASNLVKKIDKENPMESQDELQAISALTKISNDAMASGMALAKLNQDAISAAANPPPSAPTLIQLVAPA